MKGKPAISSDSKVLTPMLAHPVVKKEEEMTTIQPHLKILMMQLQMMEIDKTENEQHREKPTMQIEEKINQPVGARAAHCHRQQRLESTCEIDWQQDIVPGQQPGTRRNPSH